MIKFRNIIIALMALVMFATVSCDQSSDVGSSSVEDVVNKYVNGPTLGFAVTATLNKEDIGYLYPDQSADAQTWTLNNVDVICVYTRKTGETENIMLPVEKDIVVTGNTIAFPLTGEELKSDNGRDFVIVLGKYKGSAKIEANDTTKAQIEDKIYILGTSDKVTCQAITDNTKSTVNETITNIWFDYLQGGNVDIEIKL